MLHSSQYLSTSGSMAAPGIHTSEAWKDHLINKTSIFDYSRIVNVCLLYIANFIQKRQLESKINRASQ
jgi:hypothetical protein